MAINKIISEIVIWINCMNSRCEQREEISVNQSVIKKLNSMFTVNLHPRRCYSADPIHHYIITSSALHHSEQSL